MIKIKHAYPTELCTIKYVELIFKSNLEVYPNFILVASKQPFFRDKRISITNSFRRIQTKAFDTDRTEGTHVHSFHESIEARLTQLFLSSNHKSTMWSPLPFKHIRDF